MARTLRSSPKQAADEVVEIIARTVAQARDLVGEARGQARDQARAGQQKAAVEAFGAVHRGEVEIIGSGGPTGDAPEKPARRPVRKAASKATTAKKTAQVKKATRTAAKATKVAASPSRGTKKTATRRAARRGHRHRPGSATIATPRAHRWRGSRW